MHSKNHRKKKESEKQIKETKNCEMTFIFMFRQKFCNILLYIVVINSTKVVFMVYCNMIC